MLDWKGVKVTTVARPIRPLLILSRPIPALPIRALLIRALPIRALPILPLLIRPPSDPNTPAHSKSQIGFFKSLFLKKAFLKGTILRSGEWERDKFDFDHHFAFLTNFLKRQNFLLSGDQNRIYPSLVSLSDCNIFPFKKGFKFHARPQTGAYSCFEYDPLDEPKRMPLGKKFCIFRKLVKNAKWWSKSN